MRLGRTGWQTLSQSSFALFPSMLRAASSARYSRFGLCIARRHRCGTRDASQRAANSAIAAAKTNFAKEEANLKALPHCFFPWSLCQTMELPEPDFHKRKDWGSLSMPRGCSPLDTSLMPATWPPPRLSVRAWLFKSPLKFCLSIQLQQ